jgi:hypothetical protein
MRNESVERMAQAIARTRGRIAEQERRIAHLEQVGATTATSRQFLATLRETLELQELLLHLRHSFESTVIVERAALRPCMSDLPENGAQGSAAHPPTDARSAPPASAPDDRDPRHGAAASLRKA